MPHNAARTGPAVLANGSPRAARAVAVGDEKYLWVLVLLEVLAMYLLRQGFKRHHGG